MILQVQITVYPIQLYCNPCPLLNRGLDSTNVSLPNIKGYLPNADQQTTLTKHPHHHYPLVPPDRAKEYYQKSNPVSAIRLMKHKEAVNLALVLHPAAF